MNKAWNYGKTAEENPSIAEAIKKMNIAKVGLPSPNKGKTKENCEWLARAAKKLSERMMSGEIPKPDNKCCMKGKIPWNKGLTKETNDFIARGAKSLSDGIKEGRIIGPPSQKGRKRNNLKS